MARKWTSVPTLPHAFYGEVTIDGVPATAGTQVIGVCAGVIIPACNNPLITTAEGVYGGRGGFSPKLIVQGRIASGVPITFYVNGAAAQETFAFEAGEVTRLDLHT